jgi:hypothetical protein
VRGESRTCKEHVMSHATSSTNPAQPPRDAQPCAWLLDPTNGGRVPAMIPLEGSAGANRGTLYERLHPDLADRTRRTETVVDGRRRVHIADDVPASNAGLELLNTFQRGLLAAMSAVCGLAAIELDPVAVGPVLSAAGHPMEPAGPGPFVRWEQWQEEFPASVGASARAYQALICQVHPWIDSVEPRVADLAWLSARIVSN